MHFTDSITSKYLNSEALSEQSSSRENHSDAFSHANFSRLSEMDLKTVTPLQKLDHNVTPQRMDQSRNVSSGKMEEEILVVEEVINRKKENFIG